ncbi:YlxM family DNA-binding protein [Peptoniphilus raoultii]|uniref:YlxM family DNA-binding protein n=1 Tax=Peptoniphilus raoultii TaxID=1776387 RepID=UPI0008D9E5D1|nr:sigma factor-like helix-turn-helix DNA-binding protein [Peptoniphilus raoultii]
MDNKFFEINILLDFYGNLLSEKQMRAMSMYYLYDFSINEIAEELDISKQAVSNNILRAKANLLNYEEKLELVKNSRDREEEKKIRDERLKSLLEKFKKTSKSYDKGTLEEIETVIFE